MSDGMVVKDHVVTILEVTAISLLEMKVWGDAEPFSEIIIEGFPPDEPAVMFSVFSGPDGNWTADVPWLTPGIDGLASQQDADGDMTRVGFGVPRLDLRVNYGHDWVESFFPAGHAVAITVTDAVGVVKATAEVSTTSRPEWDGADGFQTASGDWSGGAPPDIQPGDIVIVWVDGGWTGAQVQIGDISGTIDLEADSIQGTIEVPWFPQGVEIDLECHPWGAAMPQEIMKYDTVLPDGEDTYNCSWVGEWDIQPGQVVDFQALVGDAVDNVPGVPLIGPKIAGELLRQYGSLEKVFG